MVGHKPRFSQPPSLEASASRRITIHGVVLSPDSITRQPGIMKRARMGEDEGEPQHYDQPAVVAQGYAGASEPLFPCVKLRGLPFDVTDADIRSFLVSWQNQHGSGCSLRSQ